MSYDRFRPTCPKCERKCPPSSKWCPHCGAWLFYDPPGPDGKPQAPKPRGERRARPIGVKVW